VAATVLGWFLRTWPPHEDETLALFLGRESLGDVLRTVVTERGGAPLHFALAWVVEHLGGGLTALRVVSLAFAVVSVPLIALLGRRLAGPTVGVAAALLASATWVFLFHGIFARMYSVFLFTSLLSFLALLSALDHGGRRRFVLWGLALLAMLATHPYALLVVASQLIYVLLRRERVRETLVMFAVVAVTATPFWWADLVLRDRFDVGIGGGGERLGSPAAVLGYLWRVAGDFSVGHGPWLVPVLLLALAGLALLERGRLLAACVLAVPAIAFAVATLGSATSPESRHLIYALPFFSLLLAVPLVRLPRLLAIVAFAVLLVGGVRWAHDKTPVLFDGDPEHVAKARDAAGTWLATTARPDDVLLGYEPVFLTAWERDGSFGKHVLPRADPVLFGDALRDVPAPLGRGVWVFDAHDTTNLRKRDSIPLAFPAPTGAFEARVFGPYLVIRSRRPLLTRARYVTVAKDVMRVGQRLEIGDASINLRTLMRAGSSF
jgi:4-amino-4-deoxy-L-arabinose transferase-like glycosyltransferase